MNFSIYLYTYTIHIHIMLYTINIKRGHDFDWKQEGGNGRDYREAKGGRNDVIIILKNKRNN